MDGSGDGKRPSHKERAWDIPSLLPSVSLAGAVVVACLLGLVPALRTLSGGPSWSYHLAWDVAHGPFVIGLDALSACFLMPVLGLSILASVYGVDYLLPYHKTKSLAVAWLFFGGFFGGRVLVRVARTGLLFLTVWEAMSISA